MNMIFFRNPYKTKPVKISIMLLILLTLTLFSPALFSGCTGPTHLELSGTLESTQINANSEVMGKIIDLKKNEGDKVNKDEIIAVIDSSVQKLVVKQQEAVVKLKRARLEDLTAGTRPEQLDQAQAAIRTAEITIKTAQTGIDTATTNYNYLLEKYNNAKSLHSSGSISDDLLSDAKYKLDVAKQQLENAKKQYSVSKEQVNSTKAQLALLKSGSTKQTIIAAEADLEQTEIMLEQARLVLSKYEVKAPVSGTIVLSNVSMGDIVNTGAGIASISDLTDLWVSVYVPQTDLQLVSLGQKLDLRISAIGDKTVKGSVTYISSEAEFTPKNTETNEAKQNTVFKLKVQLEESNETLKPGMTAEVLIPLS